MKTFLISLFLISNLAFAIEPAREIPTELFGIRLGEVYDAGGTPPGKKGNFPVKRFTGANKFFGEGVSYYFEPSKRYKAFPYVEEKKSKSDKYFGSSFRAYILPLIPDTISSAEELENTPLKWQPIVIEWSIKAKSEANAYYWAIDLCKTFAIDFGSKPEILDVYEKDHKSYVCTFSADNREFLVAAQYGSQRVALRYNDETSRSMSAMVETKRRKMAAKEFIP